MAPVPGIALRSAVKGPCDARRNGMQPPLDMLMIQDGFTIEIEPPGEHSVATDHWQTTRTRDRILVAGCRQGDEAAWLEVWQRYGNLVKAIARRAGCNDDQVDDVLQRTALVALEGLDRLRDDAKLGGWLAGIARFQALELRRQGRPTEELFEATATINPDPGAELDRARELATLRLAMGRLEGRCRRLIERLDLTEPADSYRAVADDEGLSPTSIGPIRRRCLNRLRALIENMSRSEG